MLIPHGTTIAVLDGSHLLLFRNSGSETDLKLAPLPAPKLAEHGTDAGKRHRSSSANPDHGLSGEDSFVASAAAWLNQQALAGKIEGLVVAAAPRALGELRLHYHKALAEKVIGELHKELAGRAPAEIEAELRAAKSA